MAHVGDSLTHSNSSKKITASIAYGWLCSFLSFCLSYWGAMHGGGWERRACARRAWWGRWGARRRRGCDHQPSGGWVRRRWVGGPGCCWEGGLHGNLERTDESSLCWRDHGGWRGWRWSRGVVILNDLGWEHPDERGNTESLKQQQRVTPEVLTWLVERPPQTQYILSSGFKTLQDQYPLLGQLFPQVYIIHYDRVHDHSLKCIQKITTQRGISCEMLGKKNNTDASFVLGISKAGGSQTCLIRVLWPIRFGKFCILYLISMEIPQAHNAHQNIKSFEKSYSQEICWILFSLSFSKPAGPQTLFLPDT